MALLRKFSASCLHFHQSFLILLSPVSFSVPFQWEQDKSLGRWVNEMRTQNTRGIIRPDRKELLEKLGFLWRINRGDRAYRPSKAKQAKQKKESTGKDNTKPFVVDPATSIVSNASVDSRNNPQQTLSKANRKRNQRVVSDSDTDNSITSIGPLEANPTLLDMDIMINHVERFREKTGHANIPENYRPHHLGPWVAAMRNEARAGKLTLVQGKKLLEAGVIIRGKEEIWQDQYDKLREFGTEHGHFQVSKSDDQELAVWTSSQREQYRKRTLRKDRKELLDKISFDFDYQKPPAHLVMETESEPRDAMEVTSLEGTFSLLAAAAAWVA